ncbi:SDR family oxidoreductase [Candidatus Entotheonella palauensis]|uniref:SDR family oxidoreductase n=1 Tax=Candidatus Entotheonella palauensis TaxID=93172 RepID=UPI00277B49E9|nr:SDR family oxidoreductase [Candidatus Entotheonella palauensis]
MLVTGSGTGIGRGVALEFAREGASVALHPAGVIGAPGDIGRLAIFLASEESRYIIGQTLVIDGGQLSIMPLTGDFRQPRQEQWGRGYVPNL